MYILIRFLLFRTLKNITFMTTDVTDGVGRFVRSTLFHHRSAVEIIEHYRWAIIMGDFWSLTNYNENCVKYNKYD